MHLNYERPELTDLGLLVSDGHSLKGQLMLKSEEHLVEKQREAICIADRFADFLKSNQVNGWKVRHASVDFDYYLVTYPVNKRKSGHAWYHSILTVFCHFQDIYAAPKAEANIDGVLNTLTYVPPRLGKGCAQIMANGEFATYMALELYLGREKPLDDCTHCTIPMPVWSSENPAQRLQKQK
jgi:hypothetical protein